ncbi:HAD-IIA family hydrolase [Granulicoccus phenolivorans]|uniref:HAD-IIA family hydrolase n=1 Tax=Granulicoccus phenolivorans TaxID=266854 RepID=UPI000416CFA9|nr:HAD-IIA family hydrolase [Granulicoccus phenolivorans]
MSPLLADRHDVALFDLDGVVYLGPRAVPGAPEGIAALRAHGVRAAFVTNNAARSPQHVADHLSELGIPAEFDDVIASSQAGAHLLSARLPAGAKVLVVGTDALAAEVRQVGLEPVSSYTDGPAAVIQGYHPQLRWPMLDEAAYAIQRGAWWVATNTDSTRPTDLGLVPGAGTAVAAVRAAVDVDPVVAGKPFAPLMTEAVRRTAAQRPIFVGDRIDTDIAGAATVGMDSLFVFTGAHGKADVVAAAATPPTHLGWDLGALLDPVRDLAGTDRDRRCGTARATLTAAGPELTGIGDTRAEQLDALWAYANLCWHHPDAISTELLDRLDQLP